MQALMKTKSGFGNVELVDIPEPACPLSGVKVEVKYGGICGTDLHVYKDTFPNYPPVILCHEFAGVVTEVGSDVLDIRPGTKVAVIGSIAVQCGKCEYCRQGYYMFCPQRRGMGHGVNGGFTRFVVVREDMVCPVGDSVTLEQAALLEPFAVAVQAIEEITPFCVGDTVLLSGPGPIGLLCLAMLVAHRCKVIVAGTETDAERLALAKRLGADVVVDVSRTDLEAVIRGETAGRGVDIAVECAGAASSIASCIRAVKSQGRILQLGIPGKPLAVDIDSVIFKAIQFLGCVGHSLKTWDRALRILNQGKVDIMPVVTHVLPLSRWKEGFDLCEQKQGIKVLLKCDE